MSKSTTTRSLIPPPRPPKPPLGVRRPAYSSWDSHTPVTMRPIILTTPPPPKGNEAPPTRVRAWPAILFVAAVFISGAVTATIAHRVSPRAFAHASPAVTTEPPIVETIAFPPPPYVTVTAAPVSSAAPPVPVSASASAASPPSQRPRAVVSRARSIPASPAPAAAAAAPKANETFNPDSPFEGRF